MWSDLQTLLGGVENTITISLLAFAIGAVVGVPLVLARTSRLFLLRTLSAFVIDLIRAVPPIVWLFIVFYGVGSSVVRLTPYPAAVYALGAVSSAYMAEIYRGGLLAIRSGQREAAQSLGFGRVGVFVSVVAPQAIRVVIPSAATWAIGLLKDTAIVSLVGVQDIAFKAEAVAQHHASGVNVFAEAGVLYILLSVPMAVLGRWTDARLARVITL
jgi:polar amino acid transport system permease protein